MTVSRTLDPRWHVSPLKFFLKVSKGSMLLLLLNTIFYSFGSIVMLLAPYYLGKAVDALSSHSGDVSPFVLYLVLCLIGYEVFYRIGHICEVRLSANIRSATKKTLFDHTTKLSFGYFAERFAGEIAHKVSVTADHLDRMVKVMTNNFFEDGISIPISALILSTIHPYYSAFIVVWAIFFISISALLTGEMNRRAGAYAAAEARTTGSIVDVYGNISAVKVYGKSNDTGRLHGRIDEETRAFRRFGWWDVLMFHSSGVSVVTMCLGLLGITAYLYGQNLVTIGAIVLVSTIALRLFNTAWSIGLNLADFLKLRGEVIQNLRDLVVAPSIIDGDHAEDSIERRTQVEYRGVTFGYSHDKPVLDDFSLTIKPGDKLGIVGLSGAGKTTFANLLLRFFDPQSGEILLNGADIRGFTQEYLRAHISYISQDTSLFHASISENIAYGSSAASPRDIERAAELAYADDFIKALPDGYGSIVGERGIKLSGGQRQRIAIARAILADRPLFLLDEATSALDSDSEAKIQKGLLALMENKTVIAIAHRLSTLSHMDKIIYLEGGRIVEAGSHQELLGRGGKYSELWNMQAGGFLPADL